MDNRPVNLHLAQPMTVILAGRLMAREFFSDRID